VPPSPVLHTSPSIHSTCDAPAENIRPLRTAYGTAP